VQQRHGDGDLKSALQNTLKQDSLADVRPPLVAYAKLSATREPCQCPLERALVASLPLTALDAHLAILTCIPAFAATSGSTTPRDASLEEVAYAGENCPIMDLEAAAIGLGWLRRQQGIDGPPQLG
jgi:hypothetical protein